MTIQEQTLPIVLLVEDEILIRLVASEGLGLLGYHVVEAGTARDGLATLREADGSIAAAVVDVGLPDGKGDDLALTIRREMPEVAVILASGYGDNGFKARFGNDPMIRVLSKPYQPEDIDVLLRELKDVRPVPQS
ncbi:MAG: response regulator [Bauldia sp.]|nr:response regulator [Bauldia sp.]